MFLFAAAKFLPAAHAPFFQATLLSSEHIYAPSTAVKRRLPQRQRRKWSTVGDSSNSERPSIKLPKTSLYSRTSLYSCGTSTPLCTQQHSADMTTRVAKTPSFYIFEHDFGSESDDTSLLRCGGRVVALQRRCSAGAADAGGTVARSLVLWHKQPVLSNAL